MKKLFIVGCGYTGRRIAEIATTKGYQVTALVRSASKIKELAEVGINTIVQNLDEPFGQILPDIAGGTVLYSVPPPGGGFEDSRAKNFCTILSAASAPTKIIYMSATSVYSETAGGVVNENSPTEPHSAMGKRRINAESLFQAYGNSCGVAVVILRISGIYGTGRLPLMQISQGQPLLKEEDCGFSNRIHAEDLANICIASIEKQLDTDIFNISDGAASSMTSYFNACADALGLPRQPQVAAEEAKQVMSPLMFSYASESRVVDNSKMLKKLGITLLYPTVKDGIAASIALNKK